MHAHTHNYASESLWQYGTTLRCSGRQSKNGIELVYGESIIMIIMKLSIEWCTQKHLLCHNKCLKSRFLSSFVEVNLTRALNGPFQLTIKLHHCWLPQFSLSLEIEMPSMQFQSTQNVILNFQSIDLFRNNDESLP